MLTIESPITEEDTESVDLFFQAIRILTTEFRERMLEADMADAFLSVGYDMLYHMAEHSLPGATHDELVSSIKDYNNIMMEKLWKRKPEDLQE